MPISCPGGGKARYRFKKGTSTRLAFCGKGDVVEVHDAKTGKTTMVKPKRDTSRRARR